MRRVVRNVKLKNEPPVELTASDIGVTVASQADLDALISGVIVQEGGVTVSGPGDNLEFDTINFVSGATVVENAGVADITIAGVAPKRVAGVTFDGGGSPPTVGSVGYIVVPYSGTIDQWHIVSDASGSAVVDVWKAAGTIPTNANTIAGSEKPTLSAQQLNSDTSLGTWTTAVTAGDVFGFEIESVTTCTRLTVEVRITES